MAKHFSEIGKKAENLIEQGNEIDKKVSSCQARVVSASNKVAEAWRELVRASETDEKGNPKGNVAQARARLSVAQNHLAASQRALDLAKNEVVQVKQQKKTHVQEVERHNEIERSNIEKLRKLKSKAFASDSVTLTAGMAERLNEAEDIRVALLESMGINATAEYVTVDGNTSPDMAWGNVAFSAIDVSGRTMSSYGGFGGGTDASYGQAATATNSKLQELSVYDQVMNRSQSVLDMYDRVRENVALQNDEDGYSIAMNEMSKDLGEQIKNIDSAIENNSVAGVQLEQLQLQKGNLKKFKYKANLKVSDKCKGMTFKSPNGKSFYDTYSDLISQQGTVYPDEIRNDCGICAMGNLANQQGGNFTEESSLLIAKGEYDYYQITDEMSPKKKEFARKQNGLTSLKQRANILNKMGYEAIKYARGIRFDEIVEHISKGHSVSISLYGDDLRCGAGIVERPSILTVFFSGGEAVMAADHTVIITGVAVNPSGEPVGFFVNDTGNYGGTNNPFIFISKEKYKKMLKETPNMDAIVCTGKKVPYESK